MSSTSGKFLKSNFIVTGMSLVSVVINFLSQTVLAYYFGTGPERDAYFSAIVVPSYLIALFLGSFTVVILPFYVDFKNKNGTNEVDVMVSKTFGLCALLMAAVTIICYFTSDYILRLVAPGFQGAELQLTIDLFKILIFSVGFQSLANFLTIFYHVENKFLLPAVNPIIVSIISLASVVLFHDYGIKSLAIGMVTGSALSMLILLRIILSKLSIQHFFRFINNDTVQLLRLSMPLFISGAVYRLTTVLERIIASELPAGSISYLGYSSQMYLMLATVVSGGIATTYFPAMSEAWSAGSTPMLQDYTAKGVKLILVFTVPIATLIVVLANPMIRLLFQRGAFSEAATSAVAGTFSILMGAFIFGSLGNVIFKVFYISKKTWALAIISTVEIFSYIVIGYVLSKYYSYLGLASALSISTGLTILIAVIVLRLNKLISIRLMFGDFWKILTASLLAGALTYLVFEGCVAIDIPSIIAAVLSGSLFLIAYLLIILRWFRLWDYTGIVSVFRNYFLVVFERF